MPTTKENQPAFSRLYLRILNSFKPHNSTIDQVYVYTPICCLYFEKDNTLIKPFPRLTKRNILLLLLFHAAVCIFRSLQHEAACDGRMFPLLFLPPPLRNRSDVAPVASPRRHSNFCIIMFLNSITFFMRAEPPLTERRVLKENGEKTFQKFPLRHNGVRRRREQCVLRMRQFCENSLSKCACLHVLSEFPI